MLMEGSGWCCVYYMPGITYLQKPSYQMEFYGRDGVVPKVMICLFFFKTISSFVVFSNFVTIPNHITFFDQYIPCQCYDVM